MNQPVSNQSGDKSPHSTSCRYFLPSAPARPGLGVRRFIAAFVVSNALALTAALPLRADPPKPQPLFDGRSLAGWSGNTDLWRIENGAITGEIKEGARLAKNEFIYWTGGEVADFELTLEFRLTGHASANSGVQIRSKKLPDAHAEGYQVDIDLAGQYLGCLYDEHTGRKMLAERGTRTSIAPDGRRWTEKFAEPAALANLSRPAGEWNTYRILAVGPHLEVWLNGTRTAVVEDHQTGEAEHSGLLALQLHSGQGPVKIQFRNLALAQLGKTPLPPAEPTPAAKAAAAARRASIGTTRKNGDPPLRRAADAENIARANESAVLWHLRANPAKPTNVGTATAQRAITGMLLTHGFQTELLAAEPDIRQPIAFAFDERGRIWVAEAYGYPQRQPEGQGKDRIVIFEDRDGDGSFETKKTFVEKLNLVSGLEVGFGGVWVGAAPHLLFIADKNRDDVPDAAPQVLLDGWGFQDTHETLNSFTWGPDGWLYGCHGVFTHSYVGKPGTPDSERKKIRAGVFRYHPTRHEFEIFAAGGSNQWGLDFNEHGALFMTHCRSFWGQGGTSYVIRNGHYWNQANNDYAPFISNRGPDFAPDLKNYLFASARYDSGEGGAGKPGTTAVYGGHSHVGTMIYLGDNFPAQYRDTLFTHNLHGHQINQQRNVRVGSAYETFHAGSDLLFSPDPTYLPVDLQYGPDGAVYAIDWTDIQHCHNPRTEVWDRSNGRLYRVSYASTYKPVKVDLVAATDLELAKLHTHRSEWFARTARRVLQERAASRALEPAALTALRAQATNTDSEISAQLRAIWTLHVTNNLGAPDLTKLLAHSADTVRAWAIQLGTEQPQTAVGSRPSAVATSDLARLAASDPSPAVRLALASAAPALPAGARWPIVSALAARADDAGDRYLPKMVWFAAAPLVAENLDRALDLAAKTALPTLTDNLHWFIARTAPGRDRLAALLASAPEASAARALRVLAFALETEAGLQAPANWPALAQRFSSSTDTATRTAFEQLAALFGDKGLLARTRATLADTATPLAARKRALDLLRRAGDTESTALLVSLLGDATLRSSVIPLLTNAADSSAAANGLISQFKSFSDAERTAALAALTGKPALALALLRAVEAGAFDRKALTALHARNLRNLRNREVTATLDRVWGRANDTSADAQAAIAKMRDTVRNAPLWAFDTAAGRKVYDRVCASCHLMNGTGGNLGPDLSGTWRNGVDYFIENIVDPNAVIGDAFQLNLITKRDGTVVSGMIEKETDTAVSVRTMTETVTIPKADIKDRQKTPQSLMPPGLLEALPEREALELLKFLTTAP